MTICPRCGTQRPDDQRRCPSCGLVRGGTISDQADRRICSVMFADISGFTALSEQMDAEVVREITNACWDEMVRIVQRYDGTVLKYIGDAVMVTFGAPKAHEDDPERAVATALEMRRGLAEVCERLGKRLPTPLELHVGINTGEVVAGLVGSSDRSDYDVIGDAVNLASRLEDASVGGQILVSESTRRATEHAFSYRALEPISVKGKRKPVAIFEVAGVRARRRSQRGLPGIETPFIGREAERARLLEALSFLRAGHGGLVTLSGPAGVGKTRLLTEFKEEVDRRNIRWVQAGASSLGETGVLAIWADLVKRILTPDRAARADGNVSVVLPVPTRATASVFLSDIIGLALPPEARDRLLQLDETAVRGQIFLAVRDLLRSHAQRAPLILVLEDLHWADEASFDLLRAVLDLAAELPLLFIATYRSDATTIPQTLPPPESLPGILRTHIELAPLSPTECAALATAVLGSDTEMAPIRQMLVEQAEGNPFYLEEILRSLADQGAIAPTPHGWRLAAENLTNAAVLPASLQGLLLDRIDRLPDGRKRLLQMASVSGRRFSKALVEMIATESGIDAGGLPDLIRDGFLEPADDDGTLRFRHAMIQEAAYSSLLLRHRRALHQRVAEALEARPELWPVRVELPAMLAHHWERAEEWTKAAGWALQAAENARRAFAPAETARMYARVLTAANQTGDAALARVALIGIADASLAGGDAERALEVLGQVRELPGTALEQAAAERRRGQALARQGMQARAGEAFARAAAHLGEPAEDEPAEVRAERAVIRIQAAFSHLARGAVLLARAAAEEAVRLHTGSDSEVDAHRLLGRIDQLEGNDERAAEHFEAALAIAEPLGDVPREATIREQLGILRAGSGNRSEGRELLRHALKDYRRVGDHAGAARCLLQLAQLALYDGALAEALALLNEGAGEAATGIEPEVGARIGLAQGRLLTLAGRWDEARAAFERAGADDEQAAGEAALELTLMELTRGQAPEGPLRAMLTAAERAGQRAAADRARLGLATIARRAGRASEARSLLRAVIEDAPNSNAQSVIEARIGLAYVAAGEGRPDIAIAVATQALAVAEEHAPMPVRWYARRVLGVALQAAGRDVEAESILRAVVDEVRAAGALTELAGALSAWARSRRALGDPTGAADVLAELRTVSATLSGQSVFTGAVSQTR